MSNEVERFAWIRRLRDLADEAEVAGMDSDAFAQMQQECTPDVITTLCDFAGHGRISGWRRVGDMRIFKAIGAMADQEFVLYSDYAALAAEVEKLRAQLHDLCDAAIEFRDEQNGPPLIRRQDQWYLAATRLKTAIDAARKGQ